MLATMQLVHVAAVACLACGDPERGSQPPPPTTACRRSYADKLGVPFVRICPQDLPGVIAEGFWIAAAPIACTGGQHETIACPPVIPLAPVRPGSRAIEARTAQLVSAEVAHRTCMLRFGGRLPTVSELARARDAIGLVTVVAFEDAGSRPERHVDVLAEWSTDAPCTTPAGLGSCRARQSPGEADSAIAWARLRSCVATPTSPAGALVIVPGQSCSPGAIPCLVAPTDVATTTRTFALACRELTVDQAIHPESHLDRAAFRCVVPDAALIGTIVQ